MSKKGVHAAERECYVERGGAGGRALDYWLQAAVELKRFLQPQQHARRKKTEGEPFAHSESPEAKVGTGVRK